MLIICHKLQGQNFNLAIQTGHSLAINDLSYSPDGSLLLSSGNDNLIVLWDILSGKQIRSFVGHTAPVHKAVNLDITLNSIILTDLLKKSCLDEGRYLIRCVKN